MSVDNSSLINNQNSVTSDILYNLKNSAGTSRSTTMELVLHIPEECVICQDRIINNSVLFHCECIVTVCQDCAMLQVAAQRATYTDGQ